MRSSTFRGPGASTWTIEEPTSRRERMRGTRDRRWTSPTQGMLFRRCRSVHTFGMRRPIAVATLDTTLRVLAVSVLPPRRLLMPRRRVRHILECRADADVRAGDRFVEVARPERRRGEEPATLRPLRR